MLCATVTLSTVTGGGLIRAGGPGGAHFKLALNQKLLTLGSGLRFVRPPCTCKARAGSAAGHPFWLLALGRNNLKRALRTGRVGPHIA